MSDRFWDERIETLPPEQRQLLQAHRVFWQLRRCHAGSTFYRDRIDSVGLDLGSYRGLTDLTRLPILRPAELTDAVSAADLAVAPEDWWRATRAWDPIRVERVATDGDLVHQADVATRALWAAGARPGQCWRLATPKHGDSLAYPAASDGAQRLGLDLQQATPRFLPAADDGIELRVAPDQPVPLSMEPRPTALVWQAETVTTSPTDGTLRALTDAFVAPTLAYECHERRGLHWADDHFLIEAVDPATGVPVGTGAKGALLITELTREGSPLIRFWTGLEGAVVAEPCGCGRTSARSLDVRRLA